MRAFDVIGIGAALVLVAALCWWLGRCAGRRDWSITRILLAALLTAIIVQLDVLAVLTLAQSTKASTDFTHRFGLRLSEALRSPEFSVFLLTFGAFLGILGWSSTPAQKKKPPVSTG